ncbi:MAG: CheY-like receiver [Hyphomicrobiales bacterium]|nr:CheY-like receiver [Hyphomicrobiales bacterium]
MSFEGNPTPLYLKTVLVVDDEPLIAMMLEDMLADLGVQQVRLASDLSAARRLLDETPVDCVILDVRLREGESYFFADFLVGQSIPLLFSTGIDPDGIAARFRNVPTLAKPFGEAELRSALLQATARKPSLANESER